MTDVELAYMAGIVDGEGSICIVKHSGAKDTPRKHPIYRAHVSVSQCDIRLPNWIKERFGGYVSNLGVPKKGHKQAYSWQITGTKQCLPFLQAIRPYLLLKTRQADIAIDFCLQQKNIRHLPDTEKESEFGRRELMVAQIKKLNYRGVPPPETKRPGAERLCDSPISIGNEHGESIRNGVPAAEYVAMVTEGK